MKIVKATNQVATAIEEVLRASDYILTTSNNRKQEIILIAEKEHPRKIINVITLNELKNFNKTKNIKRLIILEDDNLIETVLQKYSLNYAIKVSSLISKEV